MSARVIDSPEDEEAAQALVREIARHLPLDGLALRRLGFEQISRLKALYSWAEKGGSRPSGLG